MDQPRTRPLGPVRGAATDGQSWRQLYFWAGISAVVFIGLLVLALLLDFLAPPPVHGGAETLEFIARNKGIYVAEQLLWTVSNILPVLVFVTLFVALAPVNKSLALLATVVGALPWAMFLAVPVTSRGSLILVYLSDRYAAASGTAAYDAAARLRYATAAETVIAENNTPAVVGVLSALGILLISLVMLKGVLPRAVAWLGVATGTAGVIAEALRQAVPSFYLAYGLLMWAWFLAVGIALLRLARRTPRAGGGTGD
ncbi:DUF4386 family protein [Arthrobacter sp. NicSoilB8]|uniref:DUF4386 family protein n=1 Tax=Arthrobacter sp. NicSoilB8 TaxID=2830998 RepID=UPI001CC33575|nr:DUF4386 family protein [Arthrobacter sp. NicSoilB8]BCW73162.1 hypothetical protein NicSoilB8_42060 [Arthrobacter sp. NicSoilB8]